MFLPYLVCVNSHIMFILALFNYYWLVVIVVSTNHEKQIVYYSLST